MIKRTAKFSFMELREYCKYRNERINSSELDTSNYISTENILPNKGGIANATSIPSGNVVRYDKGNILISNIRPYFKKIWLADKSGGCSADVLCIKAKDNISSKYLYYLLSQQSFFDYVMAGAKGCKMPRGDKSHIMDWEVNVPSITEQKRIADFLSSLDDKIELNRRINDNLEQQAQALFKSWFVDFEPFKDGEFVDSELGMIPKGWRVGAIAEVTSNMISGDWGKESLTTNYSHKVFCIRGADIPDLKVGNRGKMPIRFILEKNFMNKRLNPDDLVIEISGGSPTQSTGRVCRISSELISYYNKAIICTNFCKAISPIKGYSAYIYYLWDSLYKQGIMFLYENGTTGIKNLDVNGLLEKLQVIIPPEEIVLKFYDAISKLSNKTLANSIESAKLAHLRDTLLPRLMSGELKINDLNC